MEHSQRAINKSPTAQAHVKNAHFFLSFLKLKTPHFYLFISFRLFQLQTILPPATIGLFHSSPTFSPSLSRQVLSCHCCCIQVKGPRGSLSFHLSLVTTQHTSYYSSCFTTTTTTTTISSGSRSGQRSLCHQDDPSSVWPVLTNLDSWFFVLWMTKWETSGDQIQVVPSYLFLPHYGKAFVSYLLGSS